MLGPGLNTGTTTLTSVSTLLDHSWVVMEVSDALEDSIAGLALRLADAPDAASRSHELNAVYNLFLTAGRSVVDLPASLFPNLREALVGVEPRAWNALNNRPRTAFRLVVAGHDDAARAVLAE